MKKITKAIGLLLCICFVFQAYFISNFPNSINAKNRIKKMIVMSTSNSIASEFEV